MGEDEDLVEMTSEELVQLLNLSISHPDHQVTADVVRQWVAWKVLPPAVGRGRGIGESRRWFRSQSNLAQAKRLAELRNAGMVTRQALQAQMWLEGWGLDFGIAKPAIVARFDAALAKIRRGITTSFDPRDGRSPTAAKRRAVAHQLGQQAEVFRQSAFLIDPEEIFHAFGPLFLGTENRFDISGILARVLRQTNVVVPPGALERITAALAGLLGDEQEIEFAGRRSIEEGALDEYELARRVFTLGRRGLAAIAKPDFRRLTPAVWAPFLEIADAVGEQVFRGHFAVLSFGATLHFLHSNPDKIAEFHGYFSHAESALDMVENHLEIQARGNENSE